MGNEEYLKKIAEELERLNNNIEKSIEMAKESMNNQTPVVAKELTVWDEVKDWLDVSYRDVLLTEAREFSKYMMSADEIKEQDYAAFVHKIAKLVQLKKNTEKYLSEEGIQKLDEELRKEMVQDD